MISYKPIGAVLCDRPIEEPTDGLPYYFSMLSNPPPLLKGASRDYIQPNGVTPLTLATILWVQFPGIQQRSSLRNR